MRQVNADIRKKAMIEGVRMWQKVGARTLIPVDALRRWMDAQADGQEVV